MKKIIFTIVLQFLLNNAWSQIFQDIDDMINMPKATLIPMMDYSDLSNEPVKYVRVNLIFLRKNDGTGGFQENNPDHIAYIYDKINNSNNIMSNIANNYDSDCYDGSAGVYYDTKIRFLYNIIFINNTYAWGTSSFGCSSLPLSLVACNDSINQSMSHAAINIFYTEELSSYDNIVLNQNCPIANGIPTMSCARLPTTDFNYNQTINMRGNFTKYYWMMNCVVGNSYYGSPDENTVYNWLNPGRIQTHELIHCLNVGDIHEPDGDCAQHLMMHNEGGYGYFLSPLEITDMHVALSQSSASRYVVETTYSSSPIIISQNKSWSNKIRIYRGLTIQDGATFQLANELIIPSETDIIVTGNGTNFSASGAIIHSPHNNTTLDVTVQNNATLVLNNNSFIENCNVSVQSGSITINNANIKLSNTGNFTVHTGAQFLMNQGLID